MRSVTARPVEPKVKIKRERVCARTSEPRADCSASANLSICIGAKRPRAKALVAHKEYKRSVRSRQTHASVLNGTNFFVILEKSVRV